MAIYRDVERDLGVLDTVLPVFHRRLPVADPDRTLPNGPERRFASRLRTAALLFVIWSRPSGTPPMKAVTAHDYVYFVDRSGRITPLEKRQATSA